MRTRGIITKVYPEVMDLRKLGSAGFKEFDETMEVAIEATPSWYWLYDLLEDEGFDVKLSHQLKTKAIAYAVERVMGFEPTTSCLGSKHSSAELHPPNSYLF